MFFKVLTAKGKTYPASENMTDPFAPAMLALGLTTDDVRFDASTQHNLKTTERVHSQPFATSFGRVAVRRKLNDELVLTVYYSESKQTVIKAAKYDKTTGRKFASVAKRSKRNR